MGLSGGWNSVFGLPRGGLKSKLERRVVIDAGDSKQRVAIELHGLVHKVIGRLFPVGTSLWANFREHVCEGLNIDVDAIMQIADAVGQELRGEAVPALRLFILLSPHHCCAFGLLFLARPFSVYHSCRRCRRYSSAQTNITGKSAAGLPHQADQGPSPGRRWHGVYVVAM